MGKKNDLLWDINTDGLMLDIRRAVDHRLRVGMNELEKMGLALCKHIIPDFDSQGIRPFRNLEEAYIAFTGDSAISGHFMPGGVSEGLRSCMDFNSSSFAFALLNALNVSLSKMYRELPYYEDLLISDKKNVRDFRAIESVQLGYFGDLPDVDPEAEDYQSMENPTDSEALYYLNQKGAIIWVNRRVIINDSINLIKRIVEHGARSARKTHARFVWDLFINNGTCPDGTEWFTAGHGNLVTDAISIAAVTAAVSALAEMTEPSPSEHIIGINLADPGLHLVVPVGMWDDAVKINQTQYTYSGNDLTTQATNPCYHLFGERNERIVACPFLQDSNDWGIIRNKEDVPIVEMSYLNGQEEPEFIITDGPTNDFAMRNDKIGYKIRHEYGGSLVEYRGGYKSVVA